MRHDSAEARPDATGTQVATQARREWSPLPEASERVSLQRVLLVLAEDPLAEHFGGMLAEVLGEAAVTRAPDVEGAVPELARERFDAIVLDVDHPSPPWMVALAMLRDYAPHVPVVVLADPARELDALKAVRAGAAEYLLKGQIFPTLVERTLRYAVERHQAAGRLARSERYFRALIESTLDVVLLLDRHRRIRYASPSIEQIAGYPASTLLGQDAARYVEPRARTGLRAAFAATGSIDRFEVPVRHASGEWRIMEVTARDLLADAAVRGIVVSCRDVTTHIHMEEALRRSEEYFRALIENTSDVISILDAEGTIRYLAPSVRKVLGFRPEDLVGHGLDAFLHPDDADIAQSLLEGIKEDGGRRKVLAELRLRHYDGSCRTFELTLENRLDDPVVAGVVANARDATERKAAEEALGVSQEQLRQLQRIEAIGRLAGGVAHDFNNLLTAMSGHIYLLSADLAEDDPRRLHVEEIRRGAMRAAGLTRQLLAFSRKQVLRPRVLDLNVVVADLQKMLVRLIGEDIVLETQLADGLGLVRADPSQIEQVLMNLVVNARDAMPAGGRLTLATCNAEIGPDHPRRYHYVTPGGYVRLAVTDTGVGMDEAVRSRVFEPFFTTKEVGKGTGLGLATVYGIVKQSEGFIWVDSAPGQGSRFEIYLPRATDAEEPDRAQAPAADTLAPGSETVLLVEDEDAVRSLAQRVLRRSGYNVLVARDGREAIDIADRYTGTIDIVVSDLVMPQVGGGEVAEEFLQRRPAARVLLISGYTPDALPTPPPGASYEYLQKPFTPDVLTRKVRDVLDGQAA